MADYDAAFSLWTKSAGISLCEDDTRDRIAFYLKRNPGLCFVAKSTGSLVGAVLCGHEGRRGILRHLAVEHQDRQNGIARALVARCLESLREQGIRKCNIFVLDTNVAGMEFWEHMGWKRLADDYRTLQMNTSNKA